VTVKFPKWNFEKFPADKDELGTQMKAVGEVMAIGKNYQEALQKAIRSREDERMGLGLIEKYQKRSLDELLSLAETPSSERFFIIYEALKKGATSTQIYERTNIKSWYSDQMKELIRIEEEVVSQKDKITDVLLKKAKKKGFSDEYIAQLIGQKKEYIKKVKEKKGIHKIYDRIKVSGIKDAEYYYSTYTSKKETINLKESRKKKVMILGGGPNRIGQGIEFDYCCVNGAFSLKEMGVKSIMVNCNPETVSTDYDISDKLYFEPLTSEDVISVYKKESPLGIICQFGGQTPLNISGELEKKGVNMLGTSVTAIKETEDRELFRKKMDKLNIPQPKSRTAYDLEEALKIARKIGYPIIVRPSFVLGGRSMKVINDENTFRKHIELTPDKNVWPLLIDRFLEEATEVEVDAVSDGEDVFIPTIMEHIEPAGVHSGNSFCVLPAKNILNKHKEKICEYARKIIKEMNIVGLVNIQLVIYKNRVYVIEVNPRASRTVPLVSKVAGVSLVRMATRIMLGEKIKELKINDKNIDFYGVKRPIFPFYFFPKTDPALGPEMLATGESMGISDSFDMAFLKTWSHEKNKLPYKGKILVSIKYKNPQLIKALKKIEKKGFDIVFNEEDKYCLPENIKMVISVVDLKEGVRDKELRRMAISRKIPLFTQVSTATAAINAIVKNSDSEFAVQSLQEWQGLK
jgi:carbamoyl-phosphate synthase large subunit